MTNEIPNYSNLKANLSSMNSYFNAQGVKLTASEQEQLKSIFKEANVEKEKDKNVEEQLVGNERTTFMNKIKDSAPNLYNKIANFFAEVRNNEILEQMKKQANDINEKIQKEAPQKLEEMENKIQKEKEMLEKDLSKLRERYY